MDFSPNSRRATLLCTTARYNKQTHDKATMCGHSDDVSTQASTSINSIPIKGRAHATTSSDSNGASAAARQHSPNMRRMDATVTHGRRHGCCQDLQSRSAQTRRGEKGAQPNSPKPHEEPQRDRPISLLCCRKKIFEWLLLKPFRWGAGEQVCTLAADSFRRHKRTCCVFMDVRKA